VLRLNHITFAAEDPERLAGFWAELLDEYSAEPAGDQAWRAAGEGPALFFNRMEKSPTIELPIHVDVNVPDFEAERERLLGLGAKLVETKSHAIGELSETWTVMRDPEGNGFCIQSPPKTDARRIGNITFSCAEPITLGKFWAAALGWPDEPIDEGFIKLLLDAGMDERERESFYVTRETPTSRPRLLFQRREKSRPASYPIHLDFRSDDRDAELERLTGLGATVEETKSDTDRTWTVMRDPESNPFCVE
jgi:predicted enzyme related to lactoylglutathione lyase